MGTWRNSATRYGRVAQGFHWVVAVLVLVQVWIGVHVDDLPLGIERIKWMSRHKAVGITILFLVLLRLAWRWLDGTPPLPEKLPALVRRSAVAVHAALYTLLIAAPLAGWLAVSAAGTGISWFGLFTLPSLFDKNPAWHEPLEELHEWLVISLAILIVLHAAAAVIHGVRRDGMMPRMLPDIIAWRRGSPDRED